MAADLPRAAGVDSSSTSGVSGAASITVLVALTAAGVTDLMTAGDAAAAAAFGVVAEGVFIGAGVEVTGLLLDATGVEADLP